MKVESYERARFRVTSHGETYTVDTLCYRGNGRCDCWPFRRYLAELQHGEKPSWKCPHIVAADGELLQMFKLSLIKQFPDTSLE